MSPIGNPQIYADECSGMRPANVRPERMPRFSGPWIPPRSKGARVERSDGTTKVVALKLLNSTRRMG